YLLCWCEISKNIETNQNLLFFQHFFAQLTISPADGTASDETDTKKKVFHHSEICLKESAVPVSCSFWLASF
ncbi:MAG: hypothetical protein JXB49_25585, partial [Bacteroidales bacterium]|nr:hypothetical protein [Bacteroidales bacterium]